MMMFVPEDRVKHIPEWWTSERYDYCDEMMEKNSKGNLFNRFINKVSHIFHN